MLVPFERRFGAVTDMRVLEQTDDLVDRVVTFGDQAVRSVLVAVRDADGWSDEVRVVFAAADVAETPT